ncbi:Armadillo [Melia azedarach]|uniref:Armadillo n=1 Tax=Melia azedarach TaxID=155640 RepID=A0ACC1XN98_MELAZ|nr:Armadillo [Melia azedarach]
MAATATTTAAPVEEEKSQSLQEELSLPILLADRVIKSAQEAESFKLESTELRKQVERLSQMLRSCVRLATSSQSLYERPVRRVAADVTKNLDRALTLVRKCKHTGVLRHVFSTANADFRKVFTLLDNSIGDMRWILTIFDPDETNLSLPPIASNDPILAWVWSFISTVQMGQIKARIDAANELASLARDNNRNRKMIVEEGGIPPLLKLLKQSTSADAQIAAANALFNIGTDQETVRLIVDVLGVPIIVGVLGESSTKVQIATANLVARLAELDPVAQEEFVRENVTRPLISLLCLDIVLDLPKPHSVKTSIHSIVQMNKEMAEKSTNRKNSDGSSRGGHFKKEREVESPELKVEVRIACAEALWKLSRGSLSCSKKITETKGLLCLAKIIEAERGELQFNCLMTIMEITVVAELNAELRRAAFKTNSPAAKAVLDQILRVIREESDVMLQIPAIRSIGCLAKTFPAKERRMIGPLVALLSNRNVDVAIEAAIALGKFVSPDNFNRSEHSKAIIEFDGVPPLMRLLKINDRAQMHGLVFLCYLALSASNSKALEQARALTALEEAARSVVPQHPDLRDLFAKAIYHLTLYQAGTHPHRQSYAP